MKKKYYPPLIKSYEIDYQQDICGMSTRDVDYGTEGRPGNDVWTESDINDEGDF